MTTTTADEFTAFISKHWWEAGTVPSLAHAILHKFEVRAKAEPQSTGQDAEELGRLEHSATLHPLDAPPKPAPDAVRSALAKELSSVGITNHRHGSPDGRGHSSIDISLDLRNRLVAALAAPVPSPDGAGEPVAWPNHPGATVDAVAFIEGVKRYPNVDRDVPDLTFADKQAACQGAFIAGFKRAMEFRAISPVRADREALIRAALKAHGYTDQQIDNNFPAATFRKNIEITVNAFLSLPVQSGAGEQ
jgi:hypothetical protein